VRDDCDTAGSSDTLAGNRLRQAGLKQGADVAVGERTTRRKETPSQTERRRYKYSLGRKGLVMH
jgi:hypothetical protein